MSSLKKNLMERNEFDNYVKMFVALWQAEERQWQIRFSDAIEMRRVFLFWCIFVSHSVDGQFRYFI